MFCTVTSTTIEKSKSLTSEELQEKTDLFETLLPKLMKYIQKQASSRASKGLDAILDEDDYVSLGLAQLWAAVLDYDVQKGDLEGWAKRRIWTNMSVLLSNSFHQKRVPRVKVGDEIILSPAVSIEAAGLLDIKAVEEPECICDLMQQEIYGFLVTRLKSFRDRVALAVLRLCLEPDDELLGLCKSRKDVKLTNKSIAARLGVAVSRVAKAKKLIYLFIHNYERCSGCKYFKKCILNTACSEVLKCDIYRQMK